MAKKDLAKLWENRVNVAKKFRDPHIQNINRWRKYYKGEQWPGASTSDRPPKDQSEAHQGDSGGFTHKAVDNIIFSNIRTVMPSINFRSPRIFVSPKKKPFRTKEGLFDTTASSAILEAILNYYYRELETKRQVDKCLLDALIGPWGIMQIGFTTQTEKFRTKPDKEGGKVSEVQELKKGSEPFVLRVSPLDLLVDIEAKDPFLSDASWIGLKWVKRLEDIKDNKDFKNTAELKSNFTVQTDPINDTVQVAGGGENGNLSSDSDWARVEGWDIWDKRTKKIYVYVPGHGKLLQERDWPLETDGFPVEILFFNEDPDSLYPISDVSIVRNNQDQLNWIISYQLQHIKNVSQRKFVVKSQTFDEEDENKLTTGGDGTIIYTTGNPADSILPIKDANVSQDIHIVAATVKQSANENLGISDFERGGVRKFETATEPSLIAQSTSIRRDEKTGVLESFIVHIERKLSQVLQQTLEPMAIPLEQETAVELANIAPTKLEKITSTKDAILALPWLNASKDDIMGEFEFSIEVGSTRPVNQEIRKRDIQELSQLLAGNPLINSREALLRIFEVYEVRDVDKLIKTDEQVQQEQQAALQAQTQAEIEKGQPKRDTDLTKTQIKSATTLEKTRMDNEATTTSTLLQGLRGDGG